MGLRLRLLLVFLLVAGISTAIVVAGVVLPKLGQHQQINDELATASLQAAQLASQYVEARLNEAEDQVTFLAQHEYLTYRNHAAARRLLHTLSARGQAHPAFAVIEADGRPVASSGPIAANSLLGWPVVKAALANNDAAIGERVRWPGAKGQAARDTLVVARRFKYYDRAGEHWGVVVEGVDLAFWNTMLNQRFKRVELFDRSGAALLPRPEGALSTDRPEVAQGLAGKSGTAVGDQNEVVAYAAVPRMGGAVLTAAPAAEKLAPLSQDIERAGRFGAIALLIAAGLSFLISHFITAPIRRLDASAAALAKGDWSAGETRLPITRADELGRLAVSFSVMAGQLRERFAGIEAVVAQRTKDLERTNNQLRYAYEELKELEQLKASFLDAVSHELRTPLNFIMGFGSSLEDEVLGPMNADQAEAVHKIMEGADRLLLIVNDLIDISQLEAGQLQLVPQPIELNEVFHVAIEQFDGLFKERQQVAIAELEADLPPAFADQERVGQILRQLLSNAHKFTDPGGTIRLKAYQQGNKVVIDVTDTGIGIPADVLPHIFESFRQGDGSRTRRHGGTGVGLTIVKRLTEAMGERIEVKSTVGEGTTFRFTLPVVQFDENGHMVAMTATVSKRQASVAGDA